MCVLLREIHAQGLVGKCIMWLVGCYRVLFGDPTILELFPGSSQQKFRHQWRNVFPLRPGPRRWDHPEFLNVYHPESMWQLRKKVYMIVTRSYSS